MQRAPHDTAGRGRPAPAEGPASLPALRADFPHFRIWQEIIGDRVRYIARRLSAGTGPHTVVAADLSELRAVLSESPAPPQAVPSSPFSAGAPNIARMYDRWLGGKDNYEADRQAADLAQRP